MINLDVSLDSRFYPLAWLLGSWEGWGMAGEENYIIQRASFAPEGEQLVQRVQCWAGKVPGQAPSMMADAPEGLRFLEAGELLWEETTRWSVLDSVPATAETPATSRCLAQAEGGPFGGHTLWELNTMGPRVMAAGKPERALDESANAPVAYARLFGLVGGELFWSQDATYAQGKRGEEDAGEIEEAVAFDETLEEKNVFSARLARVAAETE